MVSELEATLALHMRVSHIDAVPEYRFYPTRRWRFDFALPDYRIGIECEGGTWTNGRHNRGAGFEKDCEKYNRAALEGWTVLRFTKRMITSGEAIKSIEEAIQVRKNETRDAVG